MTANRHDRDPTPIGSLGGPIQQIALYLRPDYSLRGLNALSGGQSAATV